MAVKVEDLNTEDPGEGCCGSVTGWYVNIAGMSRLDRNDP